MFLSHAPHGHSERFMSDEPNAMFILYHLLALLALIVCVVLYHTGFGILVTSIERRNAGTGGHAGRECTYFVGTGMANLPSVVETCPLVHDFN